MQFVEGAPDSCMSALLCILQEAIEKKEQRAKRFHFRAEVNLAQRNVALDRDMMKKGTVHLGEKIPSVTSSQCLDLSCNIFYIPRDFAERNYCGVFPPFLLQIIIF